MKFSVPDRTKLPGGLVVFNPPWWRVDRWLFWLFLRATGARVGHAVFTALEENQVRDFELRAYED